MSDVITSNYYAFLDMQPEELRNFLPNLQEIRLRYRLKSTLPQSSQYAAADCFVWVMIIMNFIDN